MRILTLRTDKEVSEIGLYDVKKQLDYISWQAHRKLAETIHIQINKLLDRSSIDLGNIQGIVVYKGPGSFTGLRIGLSVANALAYSLNVPVVGENGDGWVEAGIIKLIGGQNHKIVLAHYGEPAKTTMPSK